jgi:hypothetical protein
MSRHKERSENAARNAAGEFAIPFGVDMPRLLFHPALATMVEVNTKLYAGLVEINKEGVDFVNRRLQADFTLPQRVGACKSPQDVFKVWSDFYRHAFDDYQDEFGKLTKMGEGLAAGVAEAMQIPQKDSP